VIIATFGWMTEEEARALQPSAVFVDKRNRPWNARPRVCVANRGVGAAGGSGLLLRLHTATGPAGGVAKLALM